MDNYKINMKKVSVIMSVYNEKKIWVQKAIESIINQTYKNIEFIIILDNPSNLELDKTIAEYSARDNRIKYYINECNKGLVESLNFGIDQCTGEYIARMDADDISELERIEKQLFFIEKNNCDIVGSRMRLISENESLLGMTGKYGLREKTAIESLKIRNIISHPTWFVKSECFKKIGKYHSLYTIEDYEWICRAITYGFKVCNMPDVLLNYRVRSSSVSSEKAYLQRCSGEIVRKEYIRCIRNHKIFDYKKVEDEILNIKGEENQYAKYSMLLRQGYGCIKQRRLFYGIYNIIRAILGEPELIESLVGAVKLKIVNLQMERK